MLMVWLFALEQYRSADNMTDRLGAIRALVNSDFIDEREQALAEFYRQFCDDPSGR